MTKPNCYACIHRGSLPGDAHSRCLHPTTGVWPGDGIVGQVQAAADKLEIQGNYYGITKGWFHWPFNFDPVWLEHCTGFEAKPCTPGPNGERLCHDSCPVCGPAEPTWKDLERCGEMFDALTVEQHERKLEKGE